MTNTPPLPPAGSTPQSPLPVPNGPADDLRASTGLPWQKERRIPAWLFSFALHFVTMAVLSFTLKGSPRGIVGGESSRGGGIAIASVASSGSTQYQFEESSTDATAQNTSGSTSATNQENAFPDASEAPAGTASAASNTSEGIAGALPGAIQGSESGSGGSGDVRLAPPGGKSGIGDGSGIETQVFGVKGQGNRFVYVFDRSSSMSGYEGRPLLWAKRELVGSLNRLQPIHQFQVIFYNQDPYVMTPFGGQSPQMLFANDAGKRAASNFISGVTADGSTVHIRALKMALRLRPDAIFFLTDADEPQMTMSELREVRALNHGCSIHAIEFGAGPSPNRFNFLKRLAEENDGNYGYVDILKLPRS